MFSLGESIVQQYVDWVKDARNDLASQAKAYTRAYAQLPQVISIFVGITKFNHSDISPQDITLMTVIDDLLSTIIADFDDTQTSPKALPDNLFVEPFNISDSIAMR